MPPISWRLYAPTCSVQDVNYFVPMPGAKSKGLLGKGQELQLLKVGSLGYCFLEDLCSGSNSRAH